MNETKNVFFEKIDEINKSLARLIKIKRTPLLALEMKVEHHYQLYRIKSIIKE